jgi:hypothetical protein
MDFVPWAIIGQHHLARGRWGRLVVASLEENAIGVGIDENTALVVDGDTGVVIGASSVLVVDPRGATRLEAPRTATGIRLELLGTDDRLNVRSGAVMRARQARSRPAYPTEAGLGDGEPSTIEALSADPFGRWSFLRLVHAFAASEIAAASLDGGTRVLELRPSDGFQGLAPEGSGTVADAGTPSGLSAGPLLLDIRVPGR